MPSNPWNPVLPISNQSSLLSHGNNKNKHGTRRGKPRCVQRISSKKAINLLNVVVHPENRDKEPQEMLTLLELFFWSASTMKKPRKIHSVVMLTLFSQMAFKKCSTLEISLLHSSTRSNLTRKIPHKSSFFYYFLCKDLNGATIKFIIFL